MKTLLPSLKEKKRYVVFDVISEQNLDKKDIENVIYNSCKNFIGEFSYSKTGINILSELGNNKKGIIRVNNKYVDYVKSSLMMIKEINGKKVVIKSIGVSGILKKAKERYLNA